MIPEQCAALQQRRQVRQTEIEIAVKFFHFFFQCVFILSQHVMLQDVASFGGAREMSRDVQVNVVTNSSRGS
jgi:hypothetical protein